MVVLSPARILKVLNVKRFSSPFKAFFAIRTSCIYGEHLKIARFGALQHGDLITKNFKAKTSVMLIKTATLDLWNKGEP